MRIGVDLGGTKIEIITLDDNGATVLRRRVQTPMGDYAGTVRIIAELANSAQSQIGASATVGIATPGALSPQSGLLRNSNSVVLNGKPLDRDIANALGQPVRLENDANCLAISEAVDGAGAGCRVVFGAILGTGVGGGIVVKGQILTGLNRIGGEWGHNPLPWATESERPRTQVLLRKTRLYRNLPFGSGPDARVFFALPKRVSGGADCGRRGGRRALRGSIARYLQGSARAKFGGTRKHIGSRCDCFGWGHLEHKLFIRRASRTDRAACIL